MLRAAPRSARRRLEEGGDPAARIRVGHRLAPPFQDHQFQRGAPGHILQPDQPQQRQPFGHAAQIALHAAPDAVDGQQDRLARAVAVQTAPAPRPTGAGRGRPAAMARPRLSGGHAPVRSPVRKRRSERPRSDRPGVRRGGHRRHSRATAAPTRKAMRGRLARPAPVASAVGANRTAKGTSSSASCIRAQTSGRVCATGAASPDGQRRLERLERRRPGPRPRPRRRACVRCKARAARSAGWPRRASAARPPRSAPSSRRVSRRSRHGKGDRQACRSASGSPIASNIRQTSGVGAGFGQADGLAFEQVGVKEPRQAAQPHRR